MTAKLTHKHTHTNTLTHAHAGGQTHNQRKRCNIDNHRNFRGRSRQARPGRQANRARGRGRERRKGRERRGSIATAFKLAAIAIIHMAATLIKCRASAAVQTVGQRERGTVVQQDSGTDRQTDQTAGHSGR